MRLAVASDHAGFALKEDLVRRLRKRRHKVLDLGTHSPAPADYPDSAASVASALLSGRADRGILICGSAVGVSVAANKFPSIRAGVCHDTYSAHQGVEHDDMNVLCLGARIVGPELAWELATAFLGARFSGEARHVRRLRKIREIEVTWMGNGLFRRPVREMRRRPPRRPPPRSRRGSTGTASGRRRRGGPGGP
jgi:ribose 5-phosphate isomerase B